MYYLRTLRDWVSKHGSKNIVYFDESGFQAHSYRPHGWAQRGQKVFGKISGNNRKVENLIMAQRGKDWLAPMLFKGSCTHLTVTAWIEQALIPELNSNSLVIMDNAPFHNKKKMKELLQEHGHTILPLPRYSPDFNPIEQSFAVIKKRRTFSNQSLDNILLGNL